MEKRLRVFIAIIVILIVAVSAISIKEVLEPTSGDVIQSEAPKEFGIDVEGQIYVIGKHLFTEKTPYISRNMILSAARTIDNLPDDMTEEQILNYITIYAKDAEENWINARTGEILALGDDFEFDIQYIDLSKISTEVSSEEDLIGAFADEKADKIALAQDINLSKTLQVDSGRQITLELNGNVLDTSNVTDSNYGFIVNGGTLIINGQGELKTSNDAKHRNIANVSGTVEINNVKMTGFNNIETNPTNSETDANTTVNNSELIANGYACIGAWNKAIINVNNSTLTGYYSAITENGTAKVATINVNNSTLSTTCEREACVLYMPCDGEMNIKKCTVTGHTGLGACAGIINVENTKINATGNHLTFDDVQSLGSEMWCDGSGILLRAQEGYADGSKLILNIDEASTISSNNGPAFRIHEYKENTRSKTWCK